MIDEAADEFVEKWELRNSIRGYLMAVENKGAMGCYLENIINYTTMKKRLIEPQPPRNCIGKIWISPSVYCGRQ